PTRKRVIRVEKVAINAVMAGCKPEYFPVVLALVEAMMIERFGIHAANASTGGMAVGFVVNGPIRRTIGMNCDGNILGPGNLANSAHEGHGADAIADTIAHYLVHSGKLTNNYCVILLPPECARYVVSDGWSKRHFQQALFDRTTRDVAWAKTNGWPQPGSPIEP